MTDAASTREAAALVAFRKAGAHCPADAVKLIDLSPITVSAYGGVTVPADFVANARKTKPALFGFDARSASKEEYDSALKDLTKPDYSGFCNHQMRLLSSQYASKVSA